MNQQQKYGIIRHTLTFIAGLFLYNGMLNENEAQEIVSGIMGLVALVWSIVEKNKKIKNGEE